MSLQAGVRLGPYEITAPLGAAMGEVYRARDTRLGRDVAVKVLPGHLGDSAERRERFEREARAVAALSHPNILALHDVGREAETAYVATELLEGETLRERLREGPLPLRKASDYATQIALGLAAAHAQGVVHRDLKPDNVFVTKDGRVKILDFGLARHVTEALTSGEQTSSPTLQRGTARNGRLQVAGAGAGRRGRLALRHLRLRLPAARDADRQACVRARLGCGNARRDHPRGARAACSDPARPRSSGS